MNAATTSTGHASATTLPAKPLPPPASLAELLDREQALAITGLLERFDHFGDDLKDLVDLPAQVRQHPLGSVGIGALGGFLASGLLVRLAGGAPNVANRLGAHVATLARGLRTALISILVARFSSALRR